MTETIHIFDEFANLGDEMTPELRHRKRTQTEHLVYDVLKAKYMPRFNEYWNTCKIPSQPDSSGCIVLTERRIHPNLEFVLKNAAYYARGWSILIHCSDINYEYCKSLLGPHKDSIQVHISFTGNPSREQGIAEYNLFLGSSDFYTTIQTPNIVIMEMDTYFRKPIPPSFFQYDFIGAPFSWDESSMGGGLNFRKRDSMRKITESFPPSPMPNDMYTCNACKTLGMKIPSFEEGLTFFVESCLYEDPVGVHQWWTFFDPSLEDADLIFHSLLTCEEIVL